MIARPDTAGTARGRSALARGAPGGGALAAVLPGAVAIEPPAVLPPAPDLDAASALDCEPVLPGAPRISPPTTPQTVVGWREWVSLPELGVPLVKAKVDTGARSCALHAFDLEEFQRGGARWVRFTVHPWQRDVAMTIRAECPLLGERSVRSSHGHLQIRPVVLSSVVVGTHRVPVELTLTNRDTMGFRMLLGRSAVRGRFVVDPGRSFVQRRPLRGATIATR